ncbi:MAG: phage tail sheath family protein [Bacteroidales bacterium]|nr:MAG: phage tail sheath family protein [Bacteroidales bacterium]
MLTQCNLLQDRFSIFDVLTDSSNSVKEDGDHFRDNNIGTDYLKYGAAYYPSLKTTINFYYKDEEVVIEDNRTGAIYPEGATLFDISNDGYASGTITITDNDKISGDTFIINGKTLIEGPDFTKGADNDATALILFNEIKDLNDSAYQATLKDNVITITATSRGYAGTLINIACTSGATISGTTLTGGIDEVLAVAATGTITIADHTLITGDSFQINGDTFTEGIGLFINDVDNDTTAAALLNAINAAGNLSYSASISGAIITITASTPGTAGNSIVLSYTDSGSGTAATVSGPTLIGGIDAVVPIAAEGTITINDQNSIEGASFIINGQTLIAGTDFLVGNTKVQAATNMLAAINGLTHPEYSASRTSNVIKITANTAGIAGNLITLSYNEGGSGVSSPTLTLTDKADKTLFNLITKEIKKNYVELYPSATIAGIYARVDRDRGVWKAPANVSVNMVKDASIAITKEEQENLNVDSTSGKSINAIRKFAGKGIIVWGARTLAGNDNEWRYIPVRRLFILIEESVKKATERVVFEPNDAKTWLKTKAMIENFLITLWKQGALVGAKPENAFYVKIGLGQTMTSLDILEGRMNIEIGLAAVRPAEFIILKFSHKLQVS